MHIRLTRLRFFDRDDAAVLARLLDRVKDFPSGYVFDEGIRAPTTTRVMISGFAIRFRTAEDGRRQILNFLLPGDTVSLYGALCDHAEPGLELVTACRIAQYPSAELLKLFHRSPGLGAAMCWLGAQDEAFLESQILRMGLLDATTRVAHLLADLRERLLAAGISPEEAARLPLNQRLIADALGLTAVHVNRCCRRLVGEGLIQTNPGIRIVHAEGLKRRCRYGHL